MPVNSGCWVRQVVVIVDLWSRVSAYKPKINLVIPLIQMELRAYSCATK